MLIKSGKGRDSKKDLGQLSMLAPICKQAQTLQTSDPLSHYLIGIIGGWPTSYVPLSLAVTDAE